MTFECSLPQTKFSLLHLSSFVPSVVPESEINFLKCGSVVVTICSVCVVDYSSRNCCNLPSTMDEGTSDIGRVWEDALDKVSVDL